MKKIILLFGILSIISTPCLAAQNKDYWGLSNGEKVQKYDKHGSYQGYYKKQGNKIQEYNKTGSYQGYYKQQSNKVQKYDKNGSYEGYYKK